jgi:hypothetical protein
MTEQKVMDRWTNHINYIKLNDSKDGVFQYSVERHEEDTFLVMEETAKNGQEDCHIYVRLQLVDIEGTPLHWEFMEGFDGKYDRESLDDYWWGAHEFRDLVNIGLSPEVLGLTRHKELR